MALALAFRRWRTEILHLLSKSDLYLGKEHFQLLGPTFYYPAVREYCREEHDHIPHHSLLLCAKRARAALQRSSLISSRFPIKKPFRK